MQLLWEALIVAALFLMRLGVPIASIFLVGCALRRLDERWRADAVAREQQLGVLGGCEAAGGALVPALISEPCWEYRACPETTRARCPAYLAQTVPCWLARRRADGQLPSHCGRCSIFATRRIGTPAAA